jgi:hypothetical protein
MKVSRSVALLGLLSGVVAAPAYADGNWDTGGTVCGGNTFETCLSVAVSWTTAGVVTVTGYNLGTLGEDWFEVGLAGLPSGWLGSVAYTPALAGTSSYGTSLIAQPGGAGIPTVTYGTAADAPKPTNGLSNGEHGTWVFTFTSFTGFDAAMANSYWAVHAGDGPVNTAEGGTCSTKIYVNAEGAGTAGPYDPNCGTSTVPEPATMGLLATGLVGIGGAGLIRRRRKSA